MSRNYRRETSFANTFTLNSGSIRVNNIWSNSFANNRGVERDHSRNVRGFVPDKISRMNDNSPRLQIISRDPVAWPPPGPPRVQSSFGYVADNMHIDTTKPPPVTHLHTNYSVSSRAKSHATNFNSRQNLATPKFVNISKPPPATTLNPNFAIDVTKPPPLPSLGLTQSPTSNVNSRLNSNLASDSPNPSHAGNWNNGQSSSLPPNHVRPLPPAFCNDTPFVDVKDQIQKKAAYTTGIGNWNNAPSSSLPPMHVRPLPPAFGNDTPFVDVNDQIQKKAAYRGGQQCIGYKNTPRIRGSRGTFNYMNNTNASQQGRGGWRNNGKRMRDWDDPFSEGTHNRGNPCSSRGRKKKKQRRDKPENYAHYCETCDKGYSSMDKFNEHISSHVKCRDGECRYMAAPKLVELHWKNQHQTGLAKKIWSLESNEELEKWKLDRRKNFPTKANIAKKASEMEAKIARGEVVEEEYFGRLRGRGRGNTRRAGRGRGPRRGGGQFHFDDSGKRLQNIMMPSKGDDSSSDSDYNEVISSVILTNSMSNSPPKQEDISTHGNEESSLKSLIGVVGNSVRSGLASLVTSYELSGESEEDVGTTKLCSEANEQASDNCSILYEAKALISPVRDELIKIECPITNSIEDGGATTPFEQLSGEPYTEPSQCSNTNCDSNHNIQAKSPHDMNGGCNKNQTGLSQRRGRRRNNRKRGHQKDVASPAGMCPNWVETKKKLSLLQKLLAPDIRHERNVLLQCVRHVVRTDYLGVGRKEVTRL